jgi:hypothetical protein
VSISGSCSLQKPTKSYGLDSCEIPVKLKLRLKITGQNGVIVEAALALV